MHLYPKNNRFGGFGYIGAEILKGPSSANIGPFGTFWQAFERESYSLVLILGTFFVWKRRIKATRAKRGFHTFFWVRKNREKRTKNDCVRHVKKCQKNFQNFPLENGIFPLWNQISQRKIRHFRHFRHFFGPKWPKIQFSVEKDRKICISKNAI